jgi:ABC-type transport system substrate-binding protein
LEISKDGTTYTFYLRKGVWYRPTGPQDHSFWNNRKFTALVDQIDSEPDVTRRKALINQAEQIMEQDP